LTNTTNENLAGAFLLLAGNCALWVDLSCRLIDRSCVTHRLAAYDLAVQIMLLDHDSVDRLWIFESQEAKTSGAARGSVSHDGALYYLAKLFEVSLE
jgi:glutathionyl-hydroquinone reductase